VTFLGALPHVQVLRAELQCASDCLLLVLERRAREIEVHPVQAGLVLLTGNEADPEAEVVARQEVNVLDSTVFNQLPAQYSGPAFRPSTPAQHSGPAGRQALAGRAP